LYLRSQYCFHHRDCIQASSCVKNYLLLIATVADLRFDPASDFGSFTCRQYQAVMSLANLAFQVQLQLNSVIKLQTIVQSRGSTIKVATFEVLYSYGALEDFWKNLSS
jgi:hypothetical protein